MMKRIERLCILLLVWCISTPAQALDGWPPICSTAGILKAPDFAGPEDITIDQALGIAYFSAVDRRVTARPPEELSEEERSRQARLGGIYRLDLTSDGELERMKILPQGVYRGNFFPHGISLLKRPGDLDLLFVISHPMTKKGPLSYVEIFAIDGEEPVLHRIDSIADPGAIDLNDLVAVGPRQFYASDNFGLSTFWAVITGSANSKVRYFDGEFYKVAADGLVFANGIATDGAHLFVGETLGNRILTYEIDPMEPAALTHLSSLNVSAGVDNLEWADDDSVTLLAGAHSSMFRFMLHAMFPNTFDAPSRITKVPSFALTEGMMVNEISDFDIDEELLSAASVAASYRNNLLIGAVFDDKALKCDLDLDGR